MVSNRSHKSLEQTGIIGIKILREKILSRQVMLNKKNLSGVPLKKSAIAALQDQLLTVFWCALPK
jgi:hypothetical protein